ncbi:vegetative cell wall protein gp1-like [Mauremys reevesii]|uniref:vegetative cell wall protein gp1-like n=1 Tax=Mauremys reevesii TaxID=260615 RepID=UPI00193FC865|nr:vegetative cell wall protein gp1-like [Mauremys reevesii]
MAAVAGGGLDPGSQLTLQGAVLGLLLSHPGGIPLRDFGRLFHQHHGRRLDLPRHSYRSLRHLLGDMKELVVLDEEGKEPWVRCRRPVCNLLPEATPPKRRLHHPQVHKEAPPERQLAEAPKSAPRPWNSCHHLAAPPGHPPAGSAPGHQPSAWLPRAASLSRFPSSRLPVAAPRQLPLLTFANQPLGLATSWGAALNSPAPAPSRLPRPTRPASPRLDPPAAEQAELEQNAYGAASATLPLDSGLGEGAAGGHAGAVRVQGWGADDALSVCPQELPSEETGLSPSLPEAVVALASPNVAPAAPAVLCPSPSISASSPEAPLAPAGPEQPPVLCSPPPGHRMAPGSPAELPMPPAASAAPWPPETGWEHESTGPITEQTDVMEGIATATPAAGTVPSELGAELSLPLALASSVSLSPAGSPCGPTPPLSLDHVVATDAVLYGLNSAPSSASCPSPKPSFSPALPGPISGVHPLMAVLSPEPAWSPIQDIPGTADSPRERSPFRPLPLGEPSLASPYKHREDGGAPWAAIKPEPRLPRISPPHPPPMGSKRKPPKRKSDSCVLL